MRKSIESRGSSISYRTAGSGKPLLLLAGWSQCADDWWDAGYIDDLAGQFKIVAIDRLGHGLSDKPHDPSLYQDKGLVADFTAVIDAEGIERTIVWGFSMGGKAAYSFATLEPTRISAVVVGGHYPHPGGEAVRQGWIEFGLKLSTPEAVAGYLRQLGMAEDILAATMERNDAAALGASCTGAAEYFADAADVRVPSLWYWGENDSDRFPEAALDLARQLDIETHVVANANHAESFRKSADVLAFVLPFLERLD